MKKESKVFLLLITLSVLIVASITIYNKVKFQNVFDEIYYDSKGATGEIFQRRSALGDIKGMSSNVINLTGIAAPEGEQEIMEVYNKDKLKSPISSLRIKNNSTNKELSVGFSYMVNDHIKISFENIYDVKTKTLKRELSFFEIDSRNRIETKEDIENMISELDISEE